MMINNNKKLLVTCNKTLSIKLRGFFCNNKLTVGYDGEHEKINNYSKNKLDNFTHIVYLFVCRNINMHDHFIV